MIYKWEISDESTAGLVVVSIPWSKQVPFQHKLGIFLPLSVSAGSHSYVDHFPDPAVTDWDAEFSDPGAVKGRCWCSGHCLSHSPTSEMTFYLVWQEALSLSGWFCWGLWSGSTFPRKSTAANLETVNYVVLKANYMAQTWLWKLVRPVLVEILNMGKNVVI